MTGRIFTLTLALGGALLLIYFINYPILAGSYHNYWGINYYLNGLIPQSYQSWQKGLVSGSPYLDDIRVDFATVLYQSYLAGLEFTPVEQTHQEGISHLRSVIARHPQNFFYYQLLGEYYGVFHKFDTAYLDKADKLLAQALEMSPNRQQILYIQAKVALQRGDRQRAYQLFKQSVELNPNSGDSHFYFGLLLFEHGERERALEELILAKDLGRAPRTLQEAILAGNVWGDLGRYDEAIFIYKEALDFFSQSPGYRERSLDLKLKIAVAAFLKGDFDLSRSRFSELQEIVDLKQTAIYPDLKPLLQKLGLPT